MRVQKSICIGNNSVFVLMGVGIWMDIDIVLKLQKKVLLLHHAVYFLVILHRVSLQFLDINMPWEHTIIMGTFIVLCAMAEELLVLHDGFNNIKIMRGIRFIQCAFCSIMIIFTEISNNSGSIMYALLMMFAVDLILTIDCTEILSILLCAGTLEVLIIVLIIVKTIIDHSNGWSTMLFSAFLIGVVLVGQAYTFGEYANIKDRELFKEKRKFESMLEKNENILNIQKTLQNTNDQLNAQKIDLKRANKQIKEANEEMKVQEEIMRHIASSFDVPDISKRIVDSVMNVKNLVFCAVYIRGKVYHNKHRNYVIRSKNSQMDEIIKQYIEEIYFSMIRTDEYEKTLNENIDKEMPFLSKFHINSVYVKVLGNNEDRYGLFMIGDNRKNLFDDNMSFYNAVTAQSNISITNAKMYNDMKHMARTDGLTGINNRVYFNQLFKETASKIVEENGCISVALFDIDKFKNVNDTYGHLAGDEAIKRIAAVTEEYIDEYEGFICRYGGEEFVCVLPNRDIDAAEPIIRGLFEKLCEQVVVYNEFEIPLSVSVGLTAYPKPCDDTEQLLKHADWCMYYAKEHGRHQLKLDDGSVVKNN